MQFEIKEKIWKSKNERIKECLCETVVCVVGIGIGRDFVEERVESEVECLERESR